MSSLRLSVVTVNSVSLADTLQNPFSFRDPKTSCVTVRSKSQSKAVEWPGCNSSQKIEADTAGFIMSPSTEMKRENTACRLWMLRT